MDRPPHSHKGQNGKIAIIGGSRFQHGAPLLSALAAEASGVDLIYIALPQPHEEVAKCASLNFQVHPFCGEELTSQDVPALLELLATMDSAVIGPGLSRTYTSLKAIEQIVAAATCTLVLDATALQPNTLPLVSRKPVILTPHLGELERMHIPEKLLGEKAKEYATTILLKGPIDHVALPDGTLQDIFGGNAGLTVGGTGDVLAGLIAGLTAQSIPLQKAAIIGAKLMKRAGETLFREQGYAYTARDVITQLPTLLHHS